MQLEALKVFCDLVDLRSFSKAAKVTGLSQPTVSRLVHQLEDRLGGLLIDRTKRPLQLTTMGQAYYEGCKRLVEQYIELEAGLRREHAELAMTVRVAAIYSVGLGDMGRRVERFEASWPHARVQVEYTHPDQVYHKVLDGAADLGLVSFPNRQRELTVVPWRDEEMVVACSPAHPLAHCEVVRPLQLDGEKYVAFDKGLVIRKEIDRFLREQDVEVEVMLEFDNIENIKKGIEIGAGLALLPEPTLRQELERGTLRAVRLEGGRLVRPLGIIHRRHHPLSTAARGFIDLLLDGSAANGRNGRRSSSPRSPSPRRGSPKKVAT